MNILLVDDEKIAIEGILANIHFEDYGIRGVYSANSMLQAQEILKKEEINIAVCDIEMPNGSGLELIEWINAYNPDIVNIILSCHTEFEFAQAAVGLSCLQYILKPPTPEVIAKAVTRAVEEVLRRRAEKKIRTFGEMYVRKQSGDAGKSQNAAEQVQKYIVDHIQEDLSTEQLSAMVYLSQNHLAREFKKKYKKTIGEYIMEYRLNLAERMLADTDLTVTAIAAKVGYPNYPYFTKIFKKHTGYTPSAYRRKNEV